MTSAEVLIACHDINAALEFYCDRLGFKVDSIFPAESPTVATIRGYGLRLRLDPSASVMAGSTALPISPVTVRIRTSDLDAFGGAATLIAPDGTIVEIIDADPPLVLPPVKQSFLLERASDEASWSVGRAGMRYRDLIPDRQGGRFVGSNIQIPTAGPVPDYVHFHKIQFQMIYCYRGWVRLVYEDQGDPFIMKAGDCVLQPPRIRHRVLESSAGMEVIEIGCPALHETVADPDTALPTGVVNPDRDFGGQRYAFHRADTAVWSPTHSGFTARRFGFHDATNGLAEAAVLKVLAAPGRLVAGEVSGESVSGELVADDSVSGESTNHSHDGDLLFTFVLEGKTTLRRNGEVDEFLLPGDCFLMPAHQTFSLVHRSSDLELLEVAIPAPE